MPEIEVNPALEPLKTEELNPTENTLQAPFETKNLNEDKKAKEECLIRSEIGSLSKIDYFSDLIPLLRQCYDPSMPKKSG